jgi:DHA1 family bicyclomycin/chloramphenicol resistance-like MFS transporter
MTQISQGVPAPSADRDPGVLFIAILGAMMAFTSLSTDIYLPAMPVMAADLHGNVELTLTGFLGGFAVAQLIWGPISDHFGRKIPLFLGLILFAIGSAGCALSTTIPQIVFWRAFQAVGACTAPMLARAMVRDLFSRTRAARMLSTVILIGSIAPIIGPLLGGQIIRFASWQAIFWMLAAIGVLMLGSLWLLPETLPPERRQSASLGNAFRNYYRLLGNWVFMRYTLGVTLFYVAVYAFVAGSPFVYIKYFGIAPQSYGWLFGLNVAGVMGLNFLNRRLVQKYSLDDLLRAAFIVASVAVLVLVAGVRLHLGGVYLIIASIFCFFSMNGIIAATSTAAAMDGVPEIAGSASALIGSLQYGSGILSSLLITWFSDGTPWAMAWIIAAAILVGATIVLFGAPRHSRLAR